MFLNDHKAIDTIRRRGDADLFWIAVTAVIAFAMLFSGLITTV
ncbi:MAG: hypothetical protein RIR97_63 [Pseudomonadota bacterium]|jgi:hypothetical protein